MTREVTDKPIWQPFRPDDWRGKGSCYPIILMTPEGDIGTPCDPWTLPDDNDWTGYLCCPTPDDYQERLAQHGVTNLMPIYRTSEAPNDNSKAVGDFTRVLKDQGMLDEDGRVKKELG